MPAQRIVLAEYFTTDDLTLLFLVRTDLDEPKVFEIKTPLTPIRQFVTANFGATAEGSQVRDLDVSAWQENFGPFVEPLLQWTDEGDIIWLVPHDVLHYLPLHALQVEGRYLIERNPVCYTPSASVMKYCHAKRKGRRSQALVFGDSRNNLPHARDEALAIAALFGATPYLQEQATKSRLKEKLATERAELDILHFACHGYFDPNQPLQSGIRFAPESNDEQVDQHQWDLTAEEIFGLEMQADLVTLSACETGVNERRPGDELIGLTRALIYAGTPSVVVSLWQVNSLSSQILMERFYKGLQQPDVLKVTALQQAQLALRKMTYAEVCAYVEQRQQTLEANQSAQGAEAMQDLAVALLALEVGKPAAAQDDRWLPFAHPYHWAPFVLIGDWK
ncbi:MAG: CHAT domain-containing protein [Caldilineaceae bacterium]